MKTLFKRFSLMGLVLIAMILVVGVFAAFAASPRDASAAAGSAGLMTMALGLIFGTTATVTDSISNVKTCKYTHNAATAPGDIIVVNSCVLIAVNTALINAENVYVYAGKVTIPKNNALVINVLDQVYWDAGDSNVNKTAGGNTPCGYCQEAAAETDTTVVIILQPTNTFAEGTITLANTKILIGGADGNAAEQTMSGDATMGNTGVVTLADNTIKHATVNVTNAQLKALRAAPKELVAAPGANKFVEFVSAWLFLVYGSNVFTETGDNMAIKFTDGSGAAVSQTIEATGFIDQAADTLTNALPKIDTIAAGTASLNKALVLHNTGDGEFGGNAGADTTMKIKVSYRIHDVTV